MSQNINITINSTGEPATTSTIDEVVDKLVEGDADTIEAVTTPLSIPDAMRSVKVLKQDDTTVTIGGYGVVFGGVDLEGDTFTADTDFMLDLVPNKPVLYDHSFDAKIKSARLGDVVTVKADDDGLWIEAQLQRNADYTAQVLELVEAGALGWSSGSVGHLVRRDENKGITNWPIVEFSLTPTPAEPRTLGVELVKQLAPNILETEQDTVTDEQAESVIVNEELPQEKEKDIIMENETQTQEAHPMADELKTIRQELAELKAQPVNNVPVVKSAPVKATTTKGIVKAFNDYIRTGDKKTLQVATDGDAVMEFWRETIVKPLIEGSLISELGLAVRTFSSGSGQPYHIVKRDVAPLAILTAECDPFTEKEPTYTEELVTPYKYTCYTDVSDEFLNDAMRDVISDLNTYAIESFTNAQNDSLVNATGVSQPKGILACFPVGHTSASNTAITIDDLKGVYFSVAHQYRNSDSVFLMSDATFQLVSCLVDGENRPLVTPDLRDPFSMLLFGHRIVVSDRMPNIGATNKIVAFGNFSQIEVGIWNNIETLVDPYSLSLTGKRRFTYWARWAFGCLDTNAVKILDMPA